MIKRNANFPVEVLGIDDAALYDTDANMHCISYTCYTKIKDSPPLRNTHVLCIWILLILFNLM